MTFQTILVLKSLAFIAMAFIAAGICIPKSIKFWTFWRRNQDPNHLSIAIIYAIAAFFLLSANFLIFIRAVAGQNV